MIIGIVSLKGGAGKSTTAINMAVAYATKGYKVTIIDTDANGTCIHWSGLRPENMPNVMCVALQTTESLRKNIKALYESYLEIVNFDKTNTDDFKIFNDLGLEMTSKYIRSLCCCYLPEYRSHFNKDDLSGLEVSQKSFVAKYIESLLESAKSV